MALSKEAVALLKNNADEVKEIVREYHSSPKTLDLFIQSHTTPPVRFKDFHGNEVRDGERYWFVNKSMQIGVNKADGYNGGNGYLTYFSTEQAAKDWIELNKPCNLSVNEIVNFIAPDGILKRDYVNELLEIIRKKEAK